jgi:hypothetical protein
VGRTLLEVLPWAIGVIMSPTAMIAIILLLMTPRAKENGGAMLAGWIISLTLVVLIAYGAVVATGIEDAPRRSNRDDTMMLVLGILCVAGGVFVLWRARRRKTPPELPRWLQAVDSFTPRRSFWVGVAVSDVKNLLLALAAVSALAATQPSEGTALPRVAFVIVGSLGILLPVGLYIFKGEGAQATLKRWRDWLVAHNAQIMAIVLLVFGAAMIVSGIAG